MRSAKRRRAGDGLHVLVDALAASRGGYATYVLGIVKAWCVTFPEDRLTVHVTEPFAAQLASSVRGHNVHLVTHPDRRPGTAWRLLRTEVLPFRSRPRADVLLATLPTIPSLWRGPSVAVVYDFRHEVFPGDFPRSQLWARMLLYSAAYRRADALITISERTANDLRHRRPEHQDVQAVLLGADHAPQGASSRSGDAVAFGHFANKDPGLLVDVWRELSTRPVPLPTLHVVGLTTEAAEDLRRQAIAAGVNSLVVLDAYLDEQTYRTLMAEAAVVLMPSRYEGFGLPVLEAMRQGIPVVISSDPALVEVADGHAHVAPGWEVSDFAEAVQRALASTPAQVEAAALHARGFTWRRAAEQTRLALLRAIAAHG